MPRNQFKEERDEDNRCPRCVLEMHHLCNDPECVCEHQLEDLIDAVIVQRRFYRPPHGDESPAGKPEDEDSDLEIDPIVDDPENPTLAELRKSHQSVTEAHRKTGM